MSELAHLHARIDALQEQLSMILAQMVLSIRKDDDDTQLVPMATNILGTIRVGDAEAAARTKEPE